jgi:hypothetical protein
MPVMLRFPRTEHAQELVDVLHRVGAELPASWTYVPYGALDSITRSGTFLVLNVRGRRPVEFGAGPGARADTEELLTTIFRRVDEARKAFADSQPDEAAVALLSPGGRSAAQWVHAMRGLVGAPGYRQAAVEEDRLWRVLEDPRTKRAARVGAAVALSATGEASKARVRVAAVACADPELQRSLVRVAQAPEEADLEDAVNPLLASRD